MTDRREQAFHAAQDQAQRSAKENAESWAASVYEAGTQKVARVFAALDDFDPLLVVEVKQRFMEEVGIPAPDRESFDETWISHDAKTVYSVYCKIDDAWEAEKNRLAVERTRRLQAAIQSACPSAVEIVLNMNTQPTPVEDA